MHTRGEREQRQASRRVVQRNLSLENTDQMGGVFERLQGGLSHKTDTIDIKTFGVEVVTEYARPNQASPRFRLPVISYDLGRCHVRKGERPEFVVR